MFNRRILLLSLALGLPAAATAQSGGWTEPVKVWHDDQVAIAYEARLSGDQLAIRVTPGRGWHTFCLDNQKRAEEKLAGKQALSVDRPTEIALSDGLTFVGPWLQTPPKDFSKPELLWYSWGYETPALFLAKVRRSGAGPARIAIRGQACTETVCKNIDVGLSLPLIQSGAPVDPKGLVQAR